MDRIWNTFARTQKIHSMWEEKLTKPPVILQEVKYALSSKCKFPKPGNSDYAGHIIQGKH